MFNMKERFLNVSVEHKGLYHCFLMKSSKLFHWQIKVNLSYFLLSGLQKPNILFRVREYDNSRAQEGGQVSQLPVTSVTNREGSLLHSVAKKLRTHL